jgi:uncharacterized protein (DUF924 family)
MWIDILTFWFPNNKFQKFWFSKNLMDQTIKDKFTNMLHQAEDKKLDDWKLCNDSCVALIILLDQFSRHIYRDTSLYTQNDLYAQELTTYYLENYDINATSSNYLAFVLLPYRHSNIKKLIESSLIIMINVNNINANPIIEKFINATNRQLKNSFVN